MIAGLGADIRPLIGEAVAPGGPVRLEDAPLGTPMTNPAWVEAAVQMVREHDAEPASAADTTKRSARSPAHLPKQ